jgi:hypothetical protein
MHQEQDGNENHPALQQPLQRNVARYRCDRILNAVNGLKSAVPPPNRAVMMRDARPWRSSNYFSADPMQPPSTSRRYGDDWRAQREPAIVRLHRTAFSTRGARAPLLVWP